jgi:hypothetical protein
VHDFASIDYVAAQAAGRREPSQFQEAILANLEDQWAASYRRTCPASELVTMNQGEVHFLFDATSEGASEHCPRTIAAFGKVSGLRTVRDVVYQAGFPMKANANQTFDRGHMMPHSAGGQFGPNIYAQDRALNRGLSAQGRRYRALERKALSTPSGVFFCHLRYSDPTDIPTWVDLGLVSRTTLEVDTFVNRIDLLVGDNFNPLELSDMELTSILDVLTTGQFGDIGEETARFYLEEHGACPVSLGDSGMPRSDARQDLDIVALVEGDLVAFEVKTTYLDKRAGTLTRQGNLYCPPRRRKRTRTDRLPSFTQGSSDYVSQRVESIVKVDGTLECRLIAVDLRSLKLQEFGLNNAGRAIGPTSELIDCRGFVLQAMAEIVEHRGYL